LAADRKFYAAIAAASHIPQGAILYQDAQQLVDQWSDSILKIADNTYRSGKLNDAIAIAEAIPETSLVYQKSQGAIKQWNGEWQKNNSYLKAAQTALDAGQWQNAITEAKKVIDTPYWQEKIKPITQKAESKIATAKTVVPRQTRRVIRRSTVSATRPVTRIATRTRIRTTPRPVTRIATKTRIRRTTPRPVATRTRTRATPRPIVRTATRTRRITLRPVTRTAPRKSSYTWTTKTVP
jgi:serine/threonine-protein kinase